MLLTRAAARAVDEALVAAGVPSVLLMENAGRGAAEVVASRINGTHRVVVLVGPGNNGGDGLALARHLRVMCEHARIDVVSTLAPSVFKGDAAVMRDAWYAIGGAVRHVASIDEVSGCLAGADVVVDALFGTGLSRPLAGVAAALVDTANAMSLHLAVALDTPSGLDVDTGDAIDASSTVFRANVTCTFAASKPGLHTGRGLVSAGEVIVIGLGAPLPSSVLATVHTRRDVFRPLAPRTLDAHKGTAGRVLVVAGAPGRVGAAWLAARGAHRGGAGLVTIASRAASQLDARALETMTLALDDDPTAALGAAVRRADAVVIGPGLGLDTHARRCVEVVAREARCPVVLDADALTWASLPSAAPRVLTPHPLELARMLHEAGGARAINADRIRHARDAAGRFDAIVVLKGAGTLVATPDGIVRVMPYADATLAVAGSGDVLAGILAARLAEAPHTPIDATCEAVHLHGRAGALLRRTLATTGRGALASELADAVPQVMAGE